MPLVVQRFEFRDRVNGILIPTFKAFKKNLEPVILGRNQDSHLKSYSIFMVRGLITLSTSKSLSMKIVRSALRFLLKFVYEVWND